MSATHTEFESMLREAVKKATEAAPRAVDDLISCASKSAEAVASVTGGAAILELAPIDQRDGSLPTYQLQLRKSGSDAPPSDLGVYRVTSSGYPIMRWYSRAKWETNPQNPDAEYIKSGDVEANFKRLLSNPESKLVVLITFFQQQPISETKPKTEKKSKPRD